MPVEASGEAGANQSEGIDLRLWRDLVRMIIEWEDACEPADVLARRIMLKYRTPLPTFDLLGN